MSEKALCPNPEMFHQAKVEKVSVSDIQLLCDVAYKILNELPQGLYAFIPLSINPISRFIGHLGCFTSVKLIGASLMKVVVK